MSGLGRELARAILLFQHREHLSCSNGQISADERALLKGYGLATKEVLENNREGCLSGQAISNWRGDVDARSSTHPG